MEYVSYVLMRAVLVLVVVLDVALLLRAVFSLFGVDEETPLGALLYFITEPVILPIRALLDRLGWFEGLPLDMSFLFTSMLLNILLMMLI